MESPDEIIKQLNLAPHPEGGHFCETYVGDQELRSGRKICSVIYYLLKYDEYSHWHRVDATECWFWHAGAPLLLTISENGESTNSVTLGTGINLGQFPHFVVPKNNWQTAVTTGNWTLVSCLVTPAFEYKGFQLADVDWKPKIHE